MPWLPIKPQSGAGKLGFPRRYDTLPVQTTFRRGTRRKLNPRNYINHALVINLNVNLRIGGLQITSPSAAHIVPFFSLLGIPISMVLTSRRLRRRLAASGRQCSSRGHLSWYPCRRYGKWSDPTWSGTCPARSGGDSEPGSGNVDCNGSEKVQPKL